MKAENPNANNYPVDAAPSGFCPVIFPDHDYSKPSDVPEQYLHPPESSEVNFDKTTLETRPTEIKQENVVQDTIIMHTSNPHMNLVPTDAKVSSELTDSSPIVKSVQRKQKQKPVRLNYARVQFEEDQEELVINDRTHIYYWNKETKQRHTVEDLADLRPGQNVIVLWPANQKWYAAIVVDPLGSTSKKKKPRKSHLIVNGYTTENLTFTQTTRTLKIEPKDRIKTGDVLTISADGEFLDASKVSTTDRLLRETYQGKINRQQDKLTKTIETEAKLSELKINEQPVLTENFNIPKMEEPSQMDTSNEDVVLDNKEPEPIEKFLLTTFFREPNL